MRILLDSSSKDPNYLQIENAIRSGNLPRDGLQTSGTSALNPSAGERAASGDHYR